MRDLIWGASQLDLYSEASKWMPIIRDLAIIIGGGVLYKVYKEIAKLKDEQIRTREVEIEAIKTATAEQVKALQARLETLEKVYEPERVEKILVYKGKQFQAEIDLAEAGRGTAEAALTEAKKQLERAKQQGEVREAKIKELQLKIDEFENTVRFFQKVLAGREMDRRLLSQAYDIIRKLPQIALYHYEWQKISYFVSEDGKDQTFRDEMIVCDVETLITEEVKFGVTEPGVTIETFNDIDFKCEVDGTPIYPVKIGGDSQTIIGKLTLSSPLEAGSRAHLKMQATIPGTWNQLRQHGKDWGVYSLKRPADLFEIQIILPKKYSNATIKALQPNVGNVERIERDDDIRLFWKIKNAIRDLYKYEITINPK